MKPRRRLSRQRLYQLRHVAAGLCSLCAEPLAARTAPAAKRQPPA